MNLDALITLEAQATPAPWDVVCDFIASDNMEFSLGTLGDNSWDSARILADQVTPENAPYNKVLVASTRNILPDILKLCKAMEAAYPGLLYLSDGKVKDLLLTYDELVKKLEEQS